MSAQTILIVEDEVLIRFELSDTLRRAGYEVVEAATGDEGMAVLLSNLDLDLVITDVRMPGQIDGLQLTAYCKRMHPSLPIIIASGHLMEDQADHADAFLRKPYFSTDLLAAVERLIGKPWMNDTQDRITF